MPANTSGHAWAVWLHRVLKVPHGAFVPPQGLFKTRHVDGHRTVLQLPGLDSVLVHTANPVLVREATLVVKVFYLASGFRPQLLEQFVHVVSVIGSRAVLLFPYVLHDQFDYDCI